MWTRRNANTGYLPGFKNLFYATLLVPIFYNRKKSKEDSSFYEKRWKSHSTSVLQQLSSRQHAPWVVRVAPPSSFLGNYPQLLSIKHISLELGLWASVLYLNLFVHLLARLPQGTAFQLYTISAYRRFHRKTTFRERGKVDHFGLKIYQFHIHWKDWCWSRNSNIWPPDAKSWLTGKGGPDAGKDWRWEEKGTKEDEMVGWHHQRDGHEFK